MKFQKGDTVAFLNEVGTGTVLGEGVDGTVRVERADGFEERFAEGELILRQALQVGRVEPKDRPPQALERGQAKAAAPGELEVDLHFDRLVNYPKNYSAQEKLNIQLREAQHAIDKALRAGIKRLIIIHGVGQGRLREEIHTLLERMDGLRFYDASFARYGRGATEVEWY